jgi:hypothetical protein
MNISYHILPKCLGHIAVSHGIACSRCLSTHDIVKDNEKGSSPCQFFRDKKYRRSKNNRSDWLLVIRTGETIKN